MNRETFKTIDDCVHEACGGLDFAEWLIANSGMDKRTILQSYMIWKFKWDKKIEDAETATQVYIDQGYAKRFADLYDGRCTARTMYERLFK
jgi:hypothetical protein